MTSPLIHALPDLRTLLTEAKTIAVVGLSEKPDRDSHSISAYLQDHGYRIVGVHPTAKSILGEPCHASLTAIPEDVRRQIDLVAIFRRAEDAPGVIEEAARLGLKTVWLPPGSSSPAAIDQAVTSGTRVVADLCLRVVHGAAMR